ncbi:MAG: hypothetical protein AAFX06_19985 [Planctomycetota bacterium]
MTDTKKNPVLFAAFLAGKLRRVLQEIASLQWYIDSGDFVEGDSEVDARFELLAMTKQADSLSNRIRSLTPKGCP